MGGVVGQFFKPFGITVSAAYIASTLVARTLSPVLSIYWLQPVKKNSNNKELNHEGHSDADKNLVKY
jgi:multidrug efflux pump subunit AcrB